MNFKDQLRKDLDIFINPNEFGEIHKLGDKELLMIIDDDSFNETKSRSADYQNTTDGIYESVKTIYIKATEYRKPSVGSYLKLDNEQYYVSSASIDNGLLKINLVSNES